MNISSLFSELKITDPNAAQAWLNDDSGPAAAVVFVTPLIAKHWLQNARPNRSISKEHIRYLSDLLLRGKFFLSPHGILFDEKGCLADGSHRLTAIVTSGVSAWFHARKYVAEDVIRNAIDAGRGRSTVDRKAMEGDKLARKTVPTVVSILSAEAGSIVKVSLSLYEEVVPKIGEEHLRAVCSMSYRKIPASLSAAAALAHPLDPKKIDELLTSIANRNYACGTEAAIARMTTRTDLSNNRIRWTLAFMRGMCAVLDGKKIEQLRDNSDGYDDLMRLRKQAGLPTKFLPVVQLTLAKQH